jgi:hypothetical protein
MFYIKLILKFILQIFLFIALRYLTVLFFFFRGIGPYCKDSFWDYIPALFFQIALLIFLILQHQRKKEKKEIVFYSIVIIVLISMFLCAHLRLLPMLIISFN